MRSTRCIIGIKSSGNSVNASGDAVSSVSKSSATVLKKRTVSVACTRAHTSTETPSCRHALPGCAPTSKLVWLHLSVCGSLAHAVFCIRQGGSSHLVTGSHHGHACVRMCVRACVCARAQVVGALAGWRGWTGRSCSGSCMVSASVSADLSLMPCFVSDREVARISSLALTTGMHVCQVADGSHAGRVAQLHSARSQRLQHGQRLSICGSLAHVVCCIRQGGSSHLITDPHRSRMCAYAGGAAGGR